MAQYMITYVGMGTPSSPEEGQKMMGQWKDWVMGMGDKVVNGGTPLVETVGIDGDGNVVDLGQSRLTGYTVIEAESMDEALAAAKQCPHLMIGTLQVSRISDMRPAG